MRPGPGGLCKRPGRLDGAAGWLRDDSHRLLFSVIYKSSTRGDRTCASLEFIGRNSALPQVKFYGWLMTRLHGRLYLWRCISDLHHREVTVRDGPDQLCVLWLLDLYITSSQLALGKWTCALYRTNINIHVRTMHVSEVRNS
jgi:hypothetical protein